MGYDGITNLKNNQFAPMPARNRGRVNGAAADLSKRLEELEDRIARLESAVAVMPGGNVTLRGEAIYLEANSFVYLGAKTKVFTENLKVKNLEFAATKKLKFFG